jgi:DNA replication protein
MDSVFQTVDVRSLLLEHYKSLGFSEPQVMVILMLHHLIEQDNSFITPELLSLKMALPLAEIDSILVGFFEKKLVAYKQVHDQTVITIDPIKHMLKMRFQQSIIHQTQEIDLKASSSLFVMIEQAFSRSLSPLEISRIRDWLSFGYTKEHILEALEQAKKMHKKTIRFMDRWLQKLVMKTNFNEEGTPAEGRSLSEATRQVKSSFDE